MNKLFFIVDMLPNWNLILLGFNANQAASGGCLTLAMMHTNTVGLVLDNEHSFEQNKVT